MVTPITVCHYYMFGLKIDHCILQLLRSSCLAVHVFVLLLQTVRVCWTMIMYGKGGLKEVAQTTLLGTKTPPSFKF